MEDDEFEWDEAKAAANEAKHGVTFEMAMEAFADPFVVTWDDASEDYGEQRFSLLGMVSNRLIFVAYTMRDETTRIITARGASRHEYRQYYEENTQ